ncbi:MAG: DNA repair protein RecO [Patescibacteria group bacterium]|jgi:hypothetical protein
MSIFLNTEAIVLAKLPLKEADRLYILFTPEFGKIEAQVKSAVTSKSKLAGSLEPISQAKIMIVKGRHLESVAGAQLLQRFNFSEPLIFGQIGLVRELFIKLLKPEVKEPVLYQNLLSYLSAMSGSAELEAKRFLTQRFIWQLLNISGFSGITDDTLYLHSAHGQNQDISGLDLPTRELLKNCLLLEPQPLQVADNLLQKLENFTRTYLRQILERDLNSFYFNLSL